MRISDNGSYARMANAYAHNNKTNDTTERMAKSHHKPIKDMPQNRHIKRLTSDNGDVLELSTKALSALSENAPVNNVSTMVMQATAVAPEVVMSTQAFEPMAAMSAMSFPYQSDLDYWRGVAAESQQLVDDKLKEIEGINQQAQYYLDLVNTTTNEMVNQENAIVNYEKAIANHEKRMDGIEAFIDKVEDKSDKAIDKLENKLEKLLDKIEKASDKAVRRYERALRKLERRLDRLESKHEKRIDRAIASEEKRIAKVKDAIAKLTDAASIEAAKEKELNKQSAFENKIEKMNAQYQRSVDKINASIDKLEANHGIEINKFDEQYKKQEETNVALLIDAAKDPISDHLMNDLKQMEDELKQMEENLKQMESSVDLLDRQRDIYMALYENTVDPDDGPLPFLMNQLNSLQNGLNSALSRVKFLEDLEREYYA